MIGHTNRDHILYLMQTGNNIHLFLYGISLDNRHDLAIGKDTMNLDTAHSGDPTCNSFGFTVCTRHDNT